MASSHRTPFPVPAVEAEGRAEFRTPLAVGEDFEEPEPAPVLAVLVDVGEYGLLEAALRIRVGGRKVAAAQLARILELSELPHLTVRVIPFDTEDFAGAGHSMLYFQAPVPQLDTAHGSVFLDAELRLKQYRDRLERVDGTALKVTESRDLINRTMREL